jgi:sugar-phosphatase
MDGLLIDSEILWHKAEVEIFGHLGVPISEAKNRSTKGMYVSEVVDFWFAKQRVGELVDAEGRMLPGAARAIDLTSERGPIALASSTPLALIVRVLDHFDLRERFQSIHSAEFEPYGKPHPGVFLSAAASLDVSPTECLVIEDSAAGVLAAKAGSMTVVAVPTPEDRSLPVFSLADLVLESLTQLSPQWLDERFA